MLITWNSLHPKTPTQWSASITSPSTSVHSVDPEPVILMNSSSWPSFITVGQVSPHWLTHINTLTVHWFLTRYMKTLMMMKSEGWGAGRIWLAPISECCSRSELIRWWSCIDQVSSLILQITKFLVFTPRVPATKWVFIASKARVKFYQRPVKYLPGETEFRRVSVKLDSSSTKLSRKISSNNLSLLQRTPCSSLVSSVSWTWSGSWSTESFSLPTVSKPAKIDNDIVF